MTHSNQPPIVCYLFRHRLARHILVYTTIHTLYRSSAVQHLQALSPEMQAEIIKNDMTNCRSPSAVLLSRIEKLKAQWPHTGAPGRPVAPTVAPRRAPDARPGAPVPASRVLPSTAPAGAVPQLRGSAARSRSPRGMQHPQGPPRKEVRENWDRGRAMGLASDFSRFRDFP